MIKLRVSKASGEVAEYEISPALEYAFEQNFKTKPPTESKFILTIGSTEDLIELLSQTDNMQIMQLASELKKHIP